MKQERQRAILKLIAEEDLEVQEELLERLKHLGFSCTQATVSRDIKELHLVKERTDSGGCKYVVSSRHNPEGHASKLQTIFRESVVSFDRAQNLIVLKTMPGLANAAAVMLDGMEIPDMVGTIAGDDTAVLIMRTTEAAQQFCLNIRLMLE